MKNYTVRRYTKDDFDSWNTFISVAKNVTFLYNRDFMEYHQDRFEDYSLLVFDAQKVVAVLPANRVGATVYSHQGLTYGGLIISEKTKLFSTIYIFKEVLKFLDKNAITNLFIKQIPTIYCDFPSDELNYLMHICKATVVMKHNVSVISLQNKIEPSRIRKRGIEKGILNNLQIRQEQDLSQFWDELLIPNLHNKYNSKPVHSLNEITNLLHKFPDNIHHYNVYFSDKLVAGITLFINKNVVKSQYISGCDLDNETGSLDFMTDFILKKYGATKRYFDFGPSHINNGLQIVESLNYFKESFGAHSVVQDFYQVATKNYSLLDGVLI